MYTIACKIPTVMALLAGIFMEAWQFSAVTESQGKTEERDYFFSRIWELLQAALFLFGSFLIAFAKPEIMVLAAKAYYSVWQYVPILCVSAVYSSFVTFLGTIYMVKKRSNLYFWTSLLGASTNIVLNLILIPSPLGVHGAAIATMISYMVLFTVRAISTNKLIPMQADSGNGDPADTVCVYRAGSSGLDRDAGCLPVAFVCYLRKSHDDWRKTRAEGRKIFSSKKAGKIVL